MNQLLWFHFKPDRHLILLYHTMCGRCGCRPRHASPVDIPNNWRHYRMHRVLFLSFFLSFSYIAIAQDTSDYLVLSKQKIEKYEKYIDNLITQGKATGIKDTAYSLRSLRSAANKAKAIKNDYLRAKTFCALGDIYFSLNIYNRALPHFARAADMFYETGTQQELAYAMLGLAKSQYYRGNYSRAAENFMGVVKNSEESPELSEEANEYLGLIYGAFQNFQRSTEVNAKSLGIKQQLHDDKGIIRVATNLSDIFYQLGKFDSAFLYADKAFYAAKKLNMTTDMYMAQFKKTASLVRLKKIKEAEQELLFFQQHRDHFQDANLRIRYQTLLGNYYLAKNQEKLSKFHYDAALAIIKHNSFPELLIIVYADMATAYFEQGYIEKAYDCYKKYNHQLSIFYTGDNVTKLANLEGLVSLEDSKDEIKHLSNENKLKALLLEHEQDLRKTLALENVLKDENLAKERQLNNALARENNYKQEKLNDEKKLSNFVSSENLLQREKLVNEKRMRISLLSGMGLIIGLGTVIFFMYRRQRKKSAIIQKQADDLQMLMKEIHHRVKNNLQVISSLLDLQSLTIKDKHASEAIKESRDRVYSMALIHQNLYKEENVIGIEMNDYINKLAESLFESYHSGKNRIALKTDIDNVVLDVDMVIPIGLVLNELISNSLKYAFGKNGTGTLFISFKKYENELLLEVKDNGAGFPKDMDVFKTTSFGYKLVKAFAQKLKAKLEVYNDNGACILLHIKKMKFA